MSTPQLKPHGSDKLSPRFQLSDRPSVAYESHFQKWDSASWVRTKAYDLAPFESDLYFYSESLAALFSHVAVRQASDEVRRKLLVLHLYNYLEFTIRLEMGPVNDVCHLMSRREFLPWLPPQMKDDAHKIYVDEGWHAETARALMSAVERETKVESLKLSPMFLETLDNLISREEPEFHSLIKLFFVIISETLITGTLKDLPKDETVQQAVRDLASRHATDEGRHHVYFREVFEFVWPRLPRALRQKVGLLLPDMILAFLRPDSRALTRMLEQFPHEFHFPGQIVEQVIVSKAVRDGISDSAAPTLRLLRDNRVFDNPAIAESFRSAGLVL